MFGDLSGMMSKLKDAQQKIEATKERLNSVLVDGIAGDGLVKVTVSGNGNIRDIYISEELTSKDEIEDYLIVALNKALDKATEIRENDLANAAKDGMPNIPGMDLFK